MPNVSVPAPGVGGGLNTFVPTFSAATGQIQIEFTRAVNRFPITQYAQIVPVQAMSGYYLKIDESETARVVNTQDLQWPLGEDRPTGINSDFQFSQFTAQRFQTSFHIPQETARQAQWDIVASHARIAAAKMMTHRAYRMATQLTTSGNYTNNNYFANTAALVGATTKISGSTNDSVQKIIRSAIETIVQNTVGAVGPQDILMIVNPKTARVMATNDGVREYIKNTPHALNFLKGDATFAAYGLPQNLFGLGGVVVDDTVRVSSRKGATDARSFFYAGSNNDKYSMVFVSRPGGLVGNEGPSFSSATIFAYEDMTVETMDDPWNRRVRGSVTDNSATVLTAPLSAVYLLDADA
jgi:hypothetical protein